MVGWMEALYCGVECVLKRSHRIKEEPFPTKEVGLTLRGGRLDSSIQQ